MHGQNHIKPQFMFIFSTYFLILLLLVLLPFLIRLPPQGYKIRYTVMVSEHF